MPDHSKHVGNLSLLLYLQFDLDIHACGHVQLHESVHGLGSGVENVDQPLVGPLFELLSAVLVLVDRSEYRYDFLFGGKRDGAGYVRARLLGRVYDLGCALVECGVVVSLKSDPDLLGAHCLFFPPCLVLGSAMSFCDVCREALKFGTFSLFLCQAGSRTTHSCVS